jgi:hypothetical protein
MGVTVIDRGLCGLLLRKPLPLELELCLGGPLGPSIGPIGEPPSPKGSLRGYGDSGLVA